MPLMRPVANCDFNHNFEHRKIDQCQRVACRDLKQEVLPPCEAELQQHIRRSAFVEKMWPDADQQTIINIQRLYKIIWFEGL